jgi:hypothetical protein
MKSKLRVISGHGGTDPGAVSGDHIERDLNVAAVLGFNDAASREYMPHDVTVITYPGPPAETRDGNTILLEKIAQANAAGADQLLIEVHHNINAPDPGTQIWYSQNAKATAGDETWQFMPILQAELAFLLGEPIPTLSSDHSRFGKLGILDDTTCTAFLIEARNVATVTGPEWEYSFGVALAKAASKYFGWPSATVTPPIASPAAPTRPAGVPADARYFGEDATLELTAWTYPDGETHFFKAGVEVADLAARISEAKRISADAATRIAAL